MMTIEPYPVLTVPDPRLREKALPVQDVDKEARDIFDRMIQTMRQDDAIGLAAIQVGITKRLIVIDVHDHQDNNCQDCKVYCMANPEITYSAPEERLYPEGCLSVPGQYPEIKRPERVTVQYIDENNKKQTLKAEGLLAVCVQHEIDHLDGILFTDYLSPMKRKLVLQRGKKVAAQKNKNKQNP